MSEYIKSEQQGSVLVIQLNRPEKFNSFVREMALDMQKELQRAGQNQSIRAVLITGSGKAFCAGQDLQEAIDPDGPELTTIVHEHYNPIIEIMRSLPKPIVVAVNGVAAGAGANIALAGDVVLAGKSASFIQAFSKIGLIPDSGGTYTLPRLIGLQRASALMMLGDKVTAEEALEMGMIYKVVDDAELESSSLELAQKLSMMPTKALAHTKDLLNQSYQNDLGSQLKAEGHYQEICGNTYDNREGITAFIEKRKPIFKGE